MFTWSDWDVKCVESATHGLFEITRAGDDYEVAYLKRERIVSGFFVKGHLDKSDFLALIRDHLGRKPLLIDHSHYGWVGRQEQSGGWANPKPPDESSVKHVFLYGMTNTIRAKSGRRGSFPATVLMIEGTPGFWNFDDVWDGSQWKAA